MKISPANIFQKMLWFEKYYQNCQASFGRSKCEWVNIFALPSISLGGTVMQGLSQDLETGCPELAIVKFLGIQIFKGGGPPYTQILTIYMYKFIKIRHDILIQSHWNYMEMSKINYML